MITVSKDAAIKDIFINKYGSEECIITARAPGRVNMIGEHTDYNDGFVFPMAINFEILMAARKRADKIVKIYSADYGQMIEFSLDEPLLLDTEKEWSNFPKGVISVLKEEGAEIPGMEIAFYGNIPQGSGLSSSAALEVATSLIVQKLSGFESEPSKLAKLCQKAENQFVGMNCGIMDQFISMMGKNNHALFLDCRSLDFKNIPLELEDYKIIICQSGVKHKLVDSEYNKRRQECESGVKVLAQKFPQIKALRDATLDQLDSVKNELSSTVYKRCRHVITENNRVLQSIKALSDHDFVRFGQLMNDSHNSLRDDYEVSCPEIDLLVDSAREISGVMGSRITGGGFGGCTVNLVSNEAVEGFSKHLRTVYLKATGIEPQFYISTAANGAEILN